MPLPEAAPPPGPAPFLFNSASTSDFAVTVTLSGSALPGASVQLRSTLDPTSTRTEELSAPEVYFSGVTNAQGRCTGLLRLPTELEELDVVVQQPGASGPYTHPELRAEWGPFAPSSRLTRSLDQLSAIQVALLED